MDHNMADQILAKLDDIAKRLTVVETQMSAVSASVGVLCSSINGNGAPGIKTEVAVLKSDVADMQDSSRWLRRTVLSGLIALAIAQIPIWFAVAFFFMKVNGQ